VRALVRDPAKAAKLGSAVEVVTGDLAKPETLGAAFAGADKAFVLAPPVAALETLEANAFEAAKKAGVKQIVNLSNFGAGSFGTSIWRWHGASEERLRALGVAWTILRPARFMSNTPYSWDSIKEQGTLFESTGDSKMTLMKGALAFVDVLRVRWYGLSGRYPVKMGLSQEGLAASQASPPSSASPASGRVSTAARPSHDAARGSRPKVC
jgi:hypothetical protein